MAVRARTITTQLMGLSLLIVALSAATSALASAPDWTDSLSDFEKRYPELAPLELPTLPSASGEARYHGERDTETQQVALTFDACSRWTENRKDSRVIQILEDSETPATLFLGGRWMIENAEITRSWSETGQFEIATHGYRHPKLNELSSEDQLLEIAYAQAAALALTGEWPRHFRPPYAEYNPDTLEITAKLGLELIQYDVASGDADPEQSPEAVASHVLNTVQAGSIVVLHLHRDDLPTAEALPLILDGLDEKGLDPVTVQTLLGP